jgi:hypothetical protein
MGLAAPVSLDANGEKTGTEIIPVRSAELCLHDTLTAFFRHDASSCENMLQRAFATATGAGTSPAIIGALAGCLYGAEEVRTCGATRHGFNAGRMFGEDSLFGLLMLTCAGSQFDFSLQK